MTHLAQILIYPIKSLDPVSVNQSLMLANRALEFDRRWAIVDSDGRIVNGKRTARIQQLRSEIDLETWTIKLREEGQPEDFGRSFHLRNDGLKLEQWLSHFFGFAVQLIENAEGGFPDDLDSPGPTLISTETLETVASWFPEITTTEARRRFRANLELSGGGAFAEDRLFGGPGELITFRLGKIEFAGVNPCARCVVPSRSSTTGQVFQGFQKEFLKHREQSFPASMNQERFDHWYRLAVNTRRPPKLPNPESSSLLRVGDELEIQGEIPAQGS